MSEMNGTAVTRYYIDVRPNQPTPPPARDDLSYLPLLSTLQAEDQTSIAKYLRPQDKLMSLASYLLKYYFIHTTARVPWKDIQVSRWPAPHRRPYWAPPHDWSNDGFKGLEFNVSHQAGLVVLIGCSTPNRPSKTDLSPDPIVTSQSSAVNAKEHQDENPAPNIRLGVDVACTNETGRTPRDMSTDLDFSNWVDVFTEMFGPRDRRNMKLQPVSDSAIRASGGSEVVAKLRRFYAYWALKEAFIKMVGEGLLADWLKNLEFEDVRAPLPAAAEVSSGRQQKQSIRHEAERGMQMEFGEIVDNFRVLLHGIEIPQNQVKMDIVALEDGFLIATATKNFGTSTVSIQQGADWIKLDIEDDIRACANGECHCV